MILDTIFFNIIVQKLNEDLIRVITSEGVMFAPHKERKMKAEEDEKSLKFLIVNL